MLTTSPDLDTSGIKNTKEPFKNIDDFLEAVNSADAGDMVILANGTYDVSKEKDTKFKDRKGTATNPIIVRAEEVGKVTLEGSAGYKFVNCEHFTWYGFNHRHKASTDDNIIFQGGSNNRFARCEVNLNDKGSKEMGERKTLWLRISNCKAMKVDHCFFHEKPSEGQFINVKYHQDNKPGEGPLFEYNHFLHHDYNKIVGDDKIDDAGGEAIQMGDSKLSRYYYRAIVRYNYFEECNGDGEMITNKSSGNIYFDNSFTKTLGTFCMRHGDSTAILGNYFEACGLRVSGRGNLIANNHFTKNSAKKVQRRPLAISSCGWEQDPTISLDLKKYNVNDKDDPNYDKKFWEYWGGHWERVVNNNIILNTFANGDGKAGSIVNWGVKQGPLIPKDNNFKGNIITAKNGKLLEIAENVIINGKKEENDKEKEIKNDVSDNIGFFTGDAEKGGLSDEMATTDEDPLLREDSDGIYRLASGSHAHEKFQGTPFKELTTVDIDGRERGPNTDAGCCQFSTELTSKPKRRITPEDVGPKATTDLGNSPDWNPQPVNPRV